MKKGQIVTIKQGSDIYNITEGQQVTILKSFWENGEGWVRVKTEDGFIKEFPDVFLI